MASVAPRPPGGKPAHTIGPTGPAFPIKLAEPLADWALARCVVRTDVYGAYRPDGGTYTAHEPLTRELLVRHFRGEVSIGTHSTSPDGRCSGASVDIDAHTDKDDPEVNWRCALASVAVFAKFGLTALILDSNGRGGFHVRSFFKKPVSSVVARWLCDQVEASLMAAGFQKPETFPKQDELTIDRPFGNWIRLPGKHHKRPHWTRIYDPRTRTWAERKAAALRLIAVAGDSTSTLISAHSEAETAKAETKPAPTRPAWTGGNKGDSAERAGEALAWIRNGGDGVDYDQWIGVGMALRELGSVGRQLWHHWSAASSKYNQGETDRKFDSFAPGVSGKSITLGSLFKWAVDAGWEYPKAKRAESSGTAVKVPGEPSVTVKHQGQQPTEPETNEELGLTELSTVEPKELEWLWDDRFPLGKISIVAGDGGIGKSFMTLYMASVVSRGAVWADAPTVPVKQGHVVLLSAEDDLADTIVPRLMGMGANLKMITALGTAKGKNGLLTPFTLQDIDRLERVMARKPGTRMIVIDPITAYLGAVDDHKNAALRGLLGPLSDFASRHRVAIIAVTHFNKSTGAKAGARIIGSVAYGNAARATWLVALDPENENRRLLMPDKANLSKKKTSMAYTITDGVVVWEPDTFKVNATEILGGSSAAPKEQRRKQAVAWLQETLAAGGMPSDEVIEKAKAAGFGKDVIWKVKAEAGVRAKRVGFGGEGVWTWVLDAAPIPPEPMGGNGILKMLKEPMGGNGATSKAPEGSHRISKAPNDSEASGLFSCGHCLRLDCRECNPKE